MDTNKKALAAQKRLRRNFKRTQAADWETRVEAAISPRLIAWRKAANARRVARKKLATDLAAANKQPVKKTMTRKFRRMFGKLRRAGLIEVATRTVAA